MKDPVWVATQGDKTKRNQREKEENKKPEPYLDQENRTRF